VAKQIPWTTGPGAGAVYSFTAIRRLFMHSAITRRFRLVLIPLACLAAAAALSAAVPPLRPNLRGRIMILEYHRFGPKDHRWVRAYSSFDHDLQTLEAQGYRPITLRAYTSGHFATPRGTTPVVITFDDGSNNQVKFTPQGKLAPDCAMAHWLAFSRRHPDFPFRGVFFVNPGPGGDSAFAQPRWSTAKLRMIVRLGGEIGNHTLTHANLGRVPRSAVEREIALGQYFIARALPGYQIVSFALPYGVYPKPRSLAWRGDWATSGFGRRLPAQIRWHYRAVVKVGASPAPSPYVAGFRPHFLPRIQVFDPNIGRWLRYFQLHPGRRFVSDGEEHAVDSLPKLAPRSRRRVQSRSHRRAANP
jgi:peptidoglycan/xylan/chitin deacetylase (PgdA/CDA1 family)